MWPIFASFAPVLALYLRLFASFLMRRRGRFGNRAGVAIECYRSIVKKCHRSWEGGSVSGRVAAGLARCGDLLVCGGGTRHSFTGVFDGCGAETAFTIEVQEGIFVQAPRLVDVGGAKLDVEGICFKEVRNLHGVNDLRHSSLK